MVLFSCMNSLFNVLTSVCSVWTVALSVAISFWCLLHSAAVIVICPVACVLFVVSVFSISVRCSSVVAVLSITVVSSAGTECDGWCREKYLYANMPSKTITAKIVSMFNTSCERFFELVSSISIMCLCWQFVVCVII